MRRAPPHATVAAARGLCLLPLLCRMDLREHLSGKPIGPSLDGTSSTVLVRYMYDGGSLAQGRLCQFEPSSAASATGLELLRCLANDGVELLRCLANDGVDLTRFYVCVYETIASRGSWMPVLRDVVDADADANDVADALLPLCAEAPDGSPVARRIDVKLFRRAAASFDAARADQAAQPSGKLAKGGYFGIGVVGAKNQANLGTLWRSAYQLGASLLFTVGTRYKNQPTDTVHAIQRVPFFELDDWNAFVETCAPKGALWVAVEFGGTPLSEFEHPPNAIYLLGSEDAGVPTSVLRACHATVSLESENYASYNVAVAGSIIMYDRLAKARRRQESARLGVRGKGTQWSAGVS